MEIPDRLFREAKTAAASRGLSLKLFLTEALQEKLGSPSRRSAGWPVPPPRLARGEMQSIQAAIDGEREAMGSNIDCLTLEVPRNQKH